MGKKEVREQLSAAYRQTDEAAQAYLSYLDGLYQQLERAKELRAAWLKERKERDRLKKRLWTTE